MIDRPQLPLYIDSSMLTTWRSCKRKFFNSYVRNIAPMGESIHLSAGGAFAAACEAARRAQFEGSPRRRLTTDELLHAAIGPYLKGWDLYDPGPDEAKNHHNVFHAFERYMEEFPPWTDPVQPFMVDGKASVEFTFAVPLDVRHPTLNTPFTFVGRFDMLGSWAGMTVGLDEKTTGALGPYWMGQWPLRGQFLGYIWALQQLGHKIDHMIVRGVCIQKTQHQFQPVPVQYPQFMVDRWYTELIATLHEIVWSWENDQFNYNFGDACSTYGGCSFRDLCLSNDETPWLSNFQPRTWSPVSMDSAA